MSEKRNKPWHGTRRAYNPPSEVVAEVLIEDAGSTYNKYEFDTRHARVRLAETVMDSKSSTLERGVVVDAVGPDGKPLPALVIVSLPTFPGCLIKARLIGGLSSGNGKPWVVGVPEADPSKGHMASIEDLTGGERVAVTRLTSTDDDGNERAWLQVEEVGVLIRQAREAFWEQKARAENAIRYGAAWKTSGSPAHRGERGEAEPHTWAEYLIPSLPARFQRYVEQMLLPEERILFFAERPEFAPPRRLALLRSQKLRHGLLVITDRQVMTMLDSLPPDSTMVDWGYVAKSTAVERVVSLWIERRDSIAEISFCAGAACGEEWFTLPFPAAYEEALQGAVDLLRGFIEPGGFAAARAYATDPGLPEGELWPDDLAQKYPHLLDLMGGTGGEKVIAAAASRGPEGRGLGPALAVTPTGLHVFTGSKSTRRPVEVRKIPIAEVSSVEIVQSVIKCKFDIFVPGDEEVDKVTLRYDYPDSPAFLRAFIAARHLLGRPAIGAG